MMKIFILVPADHCSEESMVGIYMSGPMGANNSLILILVAMA